MSRGTGLKITKTVQFARVEPFKKAAPQAYLPDEFHLADILPAPVRAYLDCGVRTERIGTLWVLRTDPEAAPY